MVSVHCALTEWNQLSTSTSWHENLGEKGQRAVKADAPGTGLAAEKPL